MSKVIVSPSTLRGTVTVPCSKSAAHRAILCAALAAGDSILSPIAISNDIRVTAEAAQALGATIREEQHTWHVTGGHPPKKASTDRLWGEWLHLALSHSSLRCPWHRDGFYWARAASRTAHRRLS